MALQIIALGLVIGLIWYFIATRSRLDKDRDQHHLASMLISVSTGRPEVARADIEAFLREKGYTGAERASRMSHAVKLAGTAVSGEAYDRVVALAKSL